MTASDSLQIFDRIQISHDGAPPITTAIPATTTLPPHPTTKLSGKWKDILYYDEDYDYSEVSEDYDDGTVNWDGPVPYKEPTPWVEVESSAPGQQWDKEVEDLVKVGQKFVFIKILLNNVFTVNSLSNLIHLSCSPYYVLREFRL